MRTTFETITPELAADWLLHRNKGNRNMKPYLLDRYATDLTQGEWMTTHQGVALDPEGNLLDGQHRLAAIVETGVAAILCVTRYHGDEHHTEGVRLKTDTGGSRTLGDAFQQAGLATRFEADRLAAVVKGMRVLEGKRGESLSAAALKAALRADRADHAAVDWAMTTFTGPGFTALHRAVFAYAYGAYPKEIAAFAAMVNSASAPVGSPAHAYIKATMAGHFRTTAGYGRREVSLKMLRLLKAHVLGEKGLTKLFATAETRDFFRSRREQMASTAGKRAKRRKRRREKGKTVADQPSKAELVHEALIHHGYDPAEAKLAIKALSARVESNAVEVLIRDGLAFLAALGAGAPAPVAEGCT